MKLKRTILSLAFVVLAASTNLAQTRVLYLGGVELRLGMAQDMAMKLLTPKYRVSAMSDGNSFTVTQYDQRNKFLGTVGVIGFDRNELSYISRTIDTTGWPDDEGYAVARAIHDAISGSILRTDSDGAKRANARIVISTNEVAQSSHGTLRVIYIFIDEQRISLAIWDGSDGKSVTATVTIQTKPW